MSLLAREITYKSLLRFAAPTILSYLFLNIYWLYSQSSGNGIIELVMQNDEWI